jgi:hypothetical protein
MVQTAQKAMFTRLLHSLASSSTLVKRSALRTLVSLAAAPSVAAGLWELGLVGKLLPLCEGWCRSVIPLPARTHLSTPRSYLLEEFSCILSQCR